MSNSINRLPTDPLATIGSFLSEKDLSPNFSIANKAFNAAAKDARLIYDYPEIQVTEPNSYVGRIARQLIPLIGTEEGRVELVRRVRQIAEKHLEVNLNILKDVDWQTLGIHKNTPVSDFTYKQINMADTIIKDRFLLKSIVRIPTLHGLIQVGNSLSQNAAILRNWLANINGLDPAAWLGGVLYTATAIGNLEIVQAILQSGRAIDPYWTLCKAVEIRNLKIVQAILQDGHAIHPGFLGETLRQAVGTRNLEIVQAILQSGRAIDPLNLGLALREAVKIGNLEIVQAILQSGRVIDPIQLGVALHTAAEIGNLEIVRAILQSGRAIDPQELGLALCQAAKIENPEMVQAIFENGHAIDLGHRIVAASELPNIGHLANSLNLFWKKCPIYLKPYCVLCVLVGGAVKSAVFSGEKVINLATSILEKCRARRNDDPVSQDLFSH